ncbi:MAG: ABC transporter ATP-binding protein, partial [Gammaproteobacteria bacterium]|nr:ABC transporter ATP-binding protein [Gammaproteobacteria bacterium]
QPTVITTAPTSPDNAAPLLEVKDLKVYFDSARKLFRQSTPIKAVDGLSLSIAPGQTLALVGESGCGKSTVAKAILQLLESAEGEINFDGQNLTRLGRQQLRRKRREFQIIFQDPYASLNPRMRVLDIVQEGMLAQKIGGDASQRRQRVVELLRQVGLPEEATSRYPHEFSGGQRQRICIARALAVDPRLVVCDEPTSALDVSIQAQVLNLLKSLQQKLELAYLFVTHDLSVVEYMADQVAVMYLGRIVEQAPVDQLMDNPRHPYTRGLLAAVPKITATALPDRPGIEGEPPSPAAPPPGCHFAPRCPIATEICHQHYPDYSEASAGHQVACHHWHRD